MTARSGVAPAQDWGNLFQSYNQDTLYKDLKTMVTNGASKIKLSDVINDKDTQIKGRIIRLLDKEKVAQIHDLISKDTQPENAAKSESTKLEVLKLLSSLIIKQDVIFEQKMNDGTRNAFAIGKIAQKIDSGEFALKDKKGNIKKYDKVQELSSQEISDIANVITNNINTTLPKKEESVVSTTTQIEEDPSQVKTSDKQEILETPLPKQTEKPQIKDAPIKEETLQQAMQQVEKEGKPTVAQVELKQELPKETKVQMPEQTPAKEEVTTKPTEPVIDKKEEPAENETVS